MDSIIGYLWWLLKRVGGPLGTTAMACIRALWRVLVKIRRLLKRVGGSLGTIAMACIRALWRVLVKIRRLLKRVGGSLGTIAMACIRALWRVLVKLGWKRLTGFAGVGIALFNFVNLTLPDPPHPRAVLLCTTDGLPDLEVVCNTHLSTKYHTGYIDFGDGSAVEIETTIPPSMPVRFFDQFCKDVKEFFKELSNYVKDLWLKPATINPPEVVGSRERFLQQSYHHQYKRGGEYHISLFLEGAENTDSMSKIVTLQKLRSLSAELVIEDLNTEFKDVTPKPSRLFKFRIMQMLHSKRPFRTTSESFAQVWPTVEATKGWVLTNCDFELVRDLQYDTVSRGIAIEKYKNLCIENKNGIRFSYSLSIQGWLFGRQYARFDGVMKCQGEPRELIEQMNRTEKVISRYGIIGVEDENRRAFVYDGKDSIQAWSFWHQHRVGSRKKEYHPTGDSKSGPIKIPCHGVELSLVDPPRWQPEGWPSKIWLEVAPLQ